jgi:hypothetical protein
MLGALSLTALEAMIIRDPGIETEEESSFLPSVSTRGPRGRRCHLFCLPAARVERLWPFEPPHSGFSLRLMLFDVGLRQPDVAQVFQGH